MSGPGFHIFTSSSGATLNLAFTTINQHVKLLNVIPSACGIITVDMMWHMHSSYIPDLVDSNLNIYFIKDNLTINCIG